MKMLVGAPGGALVCMLLNMLIGTMLIRYVFAGVLDFNRFRQDRLNAAAAVAPKSGSSKKVEEGVGRPGTAEVDLEDVCQPVADWQRPMRKGAFACTCQRC